MSAEPLEHFRAFITESFTAAAVNIFSEVQSLVQFYENENKRLRTLLQSVLQPQVQLSRIDVGSFSPSAPTGSGLQDRASGEGEELKEEQMECVISGDVMDPIKSEPDVVLISDRLVDIPCSSDAASAPASEADGDDSESEDDVGDTGEEEATASGDSGGTRAAKKEAVFCPFCGQYLGALLRSCHSCGANVQFLSEKANGSASDAPTEEDLITRYFNESYSNAEILDFLASKHNVYMSLRTLQGKKKKLSLFRQKDYSPLATVCAAIQEELKGQGQHYGYRSMWQTLRLKYSLTVRRADVMALMRKFDPQGTELRASRFITGLPRLRPAGRIRPGSAFYPAP